MEYTETMSNPQKNFFKIRVNETAEYVAQGYFVIQNQFYAGVQVSDSGVHVKPGETMALLECDDACEKSASKGFIRILGKPDNGDNSAKKQKKKVAEDIQPASTQVEETAAESISTPANTPSLEPEVNTSAKKSDELDQQVEPF